MTMKSMNTQTQVFFFRDFEIQDKNGDLMGYAQHLIVTLVSARKVKTPKKKSKGIKTNVCKNVVEQDDDNNFLITL